MSIIVYSTNCPKCNVLETKMKQKNIKFHKVNDIDLMNDLGFKHAPMMEVNDRVYDFTESVKLVNQFDGEDFEGFVISTQSE